MLKQLKYYFLPLEIVIAIFAALHSIEAVWIAFLFLSAKVILGDLLLPDDTSELKVENPFMLNLALYIHFPLLIVLIISNMYLISNSNLNLLDYLGIILSLGLLIGGAAVNVGHELTHQTKNPIKMFFGNWLYGITCDPCFAIEHVYGHHKNVATKLDPATAQRGENIYFFILKSTIGQIFSALDYESKRLKKRKISNYSFSNRIIIASFRSLSICILAFSFGGLPGLLCFLLSVVWAKILLESINYIEHYGLVREPGKPVELRHSWNSNAFMSSIILFNLTRHSHHHQKAHVEFWNLKPNKNAPEMPYGYLLMVYMTLLFPWLYKRIMRSKLEDWDQNYASDREKNILLSLE